MIVFDKMSNEIGLEIENNKYQAFMVLPLSTGEIAILTPDRRPCIIAPDFEAAAKWWKEYLDWEKITGKLDIDFSEF
jgi:hypothetical protein